MEFHDLSGLTFPNWCVGGDFNVIRRISEKLGDSRPTTSMRDFDDFIRDCELIDPPLRNASFTLSNLQEIPICKRLDGFLFLMSGSKVSLKASSLTSDHCLIVLDTNPFK